MEDSIGYPFYKVYPEQMEMSIIQDQPKRSKQKKSKFDSPPKNSFFHYQYKNMPDYSIRFNQITGLPEMDDPRLNNRQLSTVQKEIEFRASQVK